MTGFEAHIRDRGAASRHLTRASILIVAAAAVVATSVGSAEARRGGRVVRDVGIGIGAAIILNEVLKSGEQKGRAKAAPTVARASLRPRTCGGRVQRDFGTMVS